MWKYTRWPKVAKWVVTGFFVLFVLSGAMSDSSKTASNTRSAETQQVSQPTEVPQAQVTVEPTNATAPTQVMQIENQDAVATKETVGQKNAVRKAKSYLNYTGFSHDGLVAQLEYEQFLLDDAIYGADNSGANWNEQAAKKAKSYMDYSAFSRGSLIDQLKYDKFTQEQAEFGADAVGL